MALVGSGVRFCIGVLSTGTPQLDVVFEDCCVGDACAASSSHQLWSFVHVTGRHKRQGLLESATQEGHCMARRVTTDGAWGESKYDQVELDVGLLPCTARAHHAAYDCTQLWSLPALNTSRWYNRVESTHRIPPPFTPTVPAASSPAARKSGKILCWILAYPPTHANRATAVNQTWGRRCDTLLFMSSELFPDMAVVKLDIGGPEARYGAKERDCINHEHNPHLHTTQTHPCALAAARRFNRGDPVGNTVHGAIPSSLAFCIIMPCGVSYYRVNVGLLHGRLAKQLLPHAYVCIMHIRLHT